jgi:hypothetical protein
MGIFDKLFGKKEKGAIQDTTHISIEETAITLRYLSENFPNDIILYHVRDKITVETFLDTPIMSGAMINVITSDKVSKYSFPFTGGINVFATPVLLELVAKGKLDELERPFLFTDDCQVAMEATGWPLAKQPLSSMYGIHDSKK